MSKIVLLYGDEPQLLDAKKTELLQSYSSLPVQQYDDESNPGHICENLMEDSLFGDAKVFLLANPPIFKKKGKNIPVAWEKVYNVLLEYKGENPVIIVHHDTIDKGIKTNKALLAVTEAIEFKKLSTDELKKWVQSYVRSHGYTLTADGLEYMFGLIDLWDDVPVTFMQTEFDRYFLQLGEAKTIDAKFLKANASDYGAKKIFAFKDALLKKEVATLLELFPFILSYKEIDRAMAYIEGQLRLQLMVSECRANGMRLPEVVELFKKYGSTTKEYPIKLAYQSATQVYMPHLVDLLRGMYEIVKGSRTGERNITDFKNLCLEYCDRDYKG